MELVQEIHQLLMDREDTCHRTCFSLQLNGNSLDNFAELKTVEGKNRFFQNLDGWIRFFDPLTVEVF